MIPSTNKKLLVAEDWKKVYQSYRNADFKSYDFETLRRTMVQYLQENYPEDFNDFIESSEYIALVDLIAYLGQNLSFRIDLNARENFIETAQRRDSILRLAQLISYSPTRNVPANGFLKVTAISTTDSVIDANGVNLANSTIAWNDPTNSNWYQQFTNILNSAMSGSFTFGKPYNRENIDGILTEQYRINSANTDVPSFSFLKAINGINMNFEIVSSTFEGKTSIYEEAPRPANKFSFVYKNDNQGAGSANTGFFCHFRQGTLGIASFNVENPVPNEIIGINTPDINNSDVWLWQLDANGNYNILWDQVPSVTGNNIIYNSLDKNKRNIFSITSRELDQIDLNFADGSFGNLPKGQFRLLYRQSNGLKYVIKPEQMSGIIIEIPYTNKAGQNNILTFTLSLQYIVNNGASTESDISIRTKAPQAYYLQNRIVTAEDYNIAPLTLGSEIIKSKAINRISSGLSKYFDLQDPSGKYSKTNIFASDGIIYKNNYESNFEFQLASRNEVYSVIKQQLRPIVSSSSMRSFYLDKNNFPRIEIPIFETKWKQVNKASGSSRGYFYDPDTNFPVSLGSFSSGSLSYLTPGSLIKFIKVDGTYVWSKVIQVIGDGSNSGLGTLDDGTGPVILNNIVETGASIVEIIPKYVDVFSFEFETEIVNLCLAQRNFALTINETSREWDIILDTNLDTINSFSLEYQGNKTNAGLDASWLVLFSWNGSNYTVRYRLLDYVFESEKETAFFVDQDNKNYDFTNDTVIKDQIAVLSFNTLSTSTYSSLGKDYKWQIDSSIVEVDGYIEPKKVKISFYDNDNQGEIEDPDSFTNIVNPDYINSNTGYKDKFVFFQRTSDGQRYFLDTTSNFMIYPTQEIAESVINLDPSVIEDGQKFYFYDPRENIVKSFNAAGITTGDIWTYTDAEARFFAYSGRQGLKFHYTHNSAADRRLDPGKSNIIDVYLLTSTYDLEYRNWITTGEGAEPLAPTSQSLDQNFGSKLESTKTISDEIIFHPVKYKVLFGSQASLNLQATFKAVRNPSIPTSDNDLKTKILSAIDEFFSLDNWDFGQTFNFSELSTYVMNLLTPNIVNFVIVPKMNNFGNLYEIACQSNEIFISGAKISDIEIIDAITSTQLKTTNIVTNGGNS
jgi:hypothetical protein